MFPEAKRKDAGTLRVEEKQNSPLSFGLVIKCFVIPPHKNRRKCENKILLHASIAGTTKFFGSFRGGRPNG